MNTLKLCRIKLIFQCLSGQLYLIQETKLSSSHLYKLGSVISHLPSMKSAQRGWKAQPLGRNAGSATSPVKPKFIFLSGSASGIADNNARV